MFIDTHAHIYTDAFKDEYAEIVERAREANVNRILMPNIDAKSMKDVMDLHKMYPDACFPMVGLHPCSVNESFEEELDKLAEYLSKKEIIAVGEIGIDLYWDKTFEKEQTLAFRIQIQWAKKYDLPIVIHSRSSIDKTIEIVREEQDGSLRGVFHCFSEGIEEAKEIMDVGFYMGIGGVSTFKKTQDLRDTIAKIPLDHILLETDAPYLTPMPYRGKRNESSYIPYIADTVAKVKKLSIEEIAEKTTANAEALFRL
ncbi:MAG: TatD DNase family protein [Saprospiraceae bacterium]|jgi:TatD DNase family protein